MGTLVHRICRDCHTYTYEEGGFVQCDCMTVDYEAWQNGIAETPKEWLEIRPLKIPHKPRIRFVNNGDVSIRIRQTDHTYDDLVILDMRLEDGGFGWFIEQVLMEEEHQTEPRYFPTLEAAVNDAIDYIKVGNTIEWENYIPLVEEFMEVNHEQE